MSSQVVNPKSATNVDHLVGARLTTMRKAAGLTQTALGAAAGVTFQQVQKYESGANRISVGRLLQFAGVLGVSAAQFLDGIQVPGIVPAEAA